MFNHLSDSNFESEATMEFSMDENRFSMSKKQQNEPMGKKGMNKESTVFMEDRRNSICVNHRSTLKKVSLDDFDLKIQLGRGTFGKVFLAEMLSTKKLYAIKVIRKDVLIEFEQVESTKLEKDILFAADHPNLVGMDYLFTSDTRLYFVMPFVKGGELYKIFAEQRRFEENVVKFYTA